MGTEREELRSHFAELGSGISDKKPPVTLVISP